MALPKKQRIKRKIDFEKIFSQGKTVQNGFFFIYVLKNQLSFNRFAVIVSSKISPEATARNKIRRQILEVVRNLLNKINSGIDPVRSRDTLRALAASYGIDIIISVRHKVKDQKFSELESSLVDILKKANIFNR